MIDPQSLTFPDEIRTERLIIRCPREEDAPALNAVICESMENLRQWMPWAQEGRRVEESRDFCLRSRESFVARQELTMLLLLHDGSPVGGSGLHRIDWNVPKFEIGYWLATAQQGQGLMTEAVRAIADFAFEHLNAQRVEIRCDARNQRSAAVARRAGFEHEATLRRDARDHHGDLRDTLIFARLRED